MIYGFYPGKIFIMVGGRALKSLLATINLLGEGHILYFMGWEIAVRALTLPTSFVGHV